MWYVFISYVTENRVAVERLAAALRAAGIEVRLGGDDINPGDRWRVAIRSDIEGAMFFIACFSKEFSGRSKSYMNEEIEIAIGQLRQIPKGRLWFIPVVLDDSDVPHLQISTTEDLSDLHHVRLNKASWDDGISRILKALRVGSANINPQPEWVSGAASSPSGAQAATDRTAVVMRSEFVSAKPLEPLTPSVPARIHTGYVSFAACVVILVSMAAFHLLRDPLTSEQVFTTRAGEHRQLVLQDGSVVTLRGDTALRTYFSAQTRVVSLEQGEALFDVRHDPKKPFRVVTGTVSIFDIGTEFDVRRSSSRTRVVVVNGTVDVLAQAVSPREIAIEEPIRVKQGQEITYSTDGQLSPVRRSDPAQTLAWVHGLLSYSNTPLGEIVEDLQRDALLPRVVIDSSVSELPLSGIIRPETAYRWIQNLPVFFPVEVIHSKPDLILIRRRK